VQFVGAVLSSAALLAVFAGAFLPNHIRFAYSLLAGLGFRIGFALYDLPQNSLMALVPADATGRIRFAAIRILLSGLATLTVAGTVGPLIAASSGREGSLFLLVIASVFGAIAIASAWHFACLLHRTALPIDTHNAPHRTPTWKISFQRDFWLLICLMFVTSSFTPIFSKLEPYFAAYVLQSPFWGGSVVIVMALGGPTGVWCTSRSRSKVSQERLMLGAAVLQLASLTGFWLSGSAHPVASVVCAFVFGLGTGGVGTMLWGLFSGTVARLEPHYTGISYGIFAAASRVASAGSIFVVGFALAGIDFRASDTLQILALMTALPAFGAVLVVLIGVGLLSRPSSGSFSKHS
jgi:Na+/melibiose symporter-like transporter